MLSAILLAAAAATGASQGCAFEADDGVVVFSEQLTPQYELRNDPAFAGDSFTYAGSTYLKFGAPITVTAYEIEAFGQIGDVPLFVDASTYDDSVVYVMLSSAECTFQRYELKG